HTFDVLQDADSVAEARLPRFGQFYTRGMAIQQRRAHGRFQIGNPLAGRRHSQVRLARPGRDAAQPSHRHKEAKGDEIEAGKIHDADNSAELEKRDRLMRIVTIFIGKS
ncbi:hypothetical protein NLQ73_24825, partial [Escherichia coli]|nr:hypothetical protein [Escherichia coli]